MKIIKYLTILSALLFNNIGAMGQMLDYEDDVYPVVINQPKEISYPVLFDFQKQVPYHANAYFQLGLIFKEWTMEYDPFTDYNIIMYFASQAETYFSLCINNLDKREARKHGDWYQGAKKQEDNWWHKPEDIMKVVLKHRSELKEYKQNVRKMRNYLLKSAQHYDECIKLFREINSEHNKIKDIYLKADEKLKEKTTELKNTFDSTIFYFNKYSNALALYPLEGYDQDYRLASINTYHLQGLTDENFLSNNIVLWDFKSWVDDLYRVINNEILALKQKIKECDMEIEQCLHEIKNNQGGEPYTMPRKLTFLISKYDYQSVILDLFNYKTSKTQFLSDYYDESNKPISKIHDELFRKKSTYYHQFVNEKLLTDSLLKNFNRKITEDEYEKYANFFRANYGDVGKIKEFTEKQSAENDDYMNRSYKNLLSSVIKYEQSCISDTLISHKKKNFFLHKCPSEKNDSLYGYKTLSLKSYKNNYYLCGYINDSLKNDRAFLAKVDTAHKIKWVKEMETQRNIQKRAMQLDIKHDTIVTIVHAVDTHNLSASNILYKMDQEGNINEKTSLDYHRKPNYLIYDDLNQTLLMTFQDLSIDTLELNLDTLKIAKTNSSLDSTHWEVNLPYKGNLADIVRMDLNYLVFCNYKEFEDISNPNANNTRKQAKSSSLALYIDEKGRVNKIFDYKKEKPYFLINAEKLNSETINLQGIQSEYFNILEKEGLENQYRMYYSTINSEGKEIFNNLE